MRSLFDGLQAVWQLNDTGWTDLVNGIVLSNNNSVTSVAGKLGNAAHFVKASNQSLSCADNVKLSTGGTNFMLGFWARFHTSFPAINATQACVAKATSTGTIGCEYIASVAKGSTTSVATPSWRVGDGSITPHLVSGTADMIALSTWYWFLCDWDQNDDLGLGLSTIGLTINNGTRFANGADPAGWDSSLPFSIGGYGSLVAANADIDQVCFWKRQRLLSADEQAFLYGGGTPPDFPWGGLDGPIFTGGMQEMLSGVLG